MSRTSVIASTLLVLSCSSTVELSTAPQLVQSADPTVLGVINETVSNIIVDDERVYWLGTTGPNVVWRGALRSCAKKNCATSLMTYGNTTVNEAVGYGLENGQIYWLSLKSGHQQAWQLLTCAAMGWVGDPLLVQDDISSDPTATAFSSDSMYMAMNGYPGLVRVPLSGGSAQQLPYNEGIINALAVQGDYLYWLGSSHGYETSPTALERTRTDGTGTVEVLLDDSKFQLTSVRSSLPVLPLIPSTPIGAKVHCAERLTAARSRVAAHQTSSPHQYARRPRWRSTARGSTGNTTRPRMGSRSRAA